MRAMVLSFHTVAQRQHGVVTRAQLRSCGLGDDAIDRRLRSGTLLRVQPAVFAIQGSPETFERRITAAILAAGGDAAASHRSAAVLLGLGELPRAVEISVPRTQRPRLRDVKVHHVQRLPRAHVIQRGGLRITTLARTLCDLAGVLSVDALELLLDEALSRRRLKRVDIVETLADLAPNTRGLGSLRALLAARPEGEARVESALEQDLAVLLKRARIEGWTPQCEIAGRRVDVAFPAERLALQVDSYRHHSSRSDWQLDHRRHADLVAAGWRVLPVTLEDLQRGSALVARIAAARSARRS